MVAIALGGVVFEQAIFETCSVRVGGRVLMAGKEIFDFKAHLLVYRATLIESTRRFKGSAGLGQLLQLTRGAHAVTTCVDRQKGRNRAAAVRGHRLTKPLLRKRILALLEGFDSGEDSRCGVAGRRWPLGRESRRLGLLQGLHELRGVETIASLRPKDEAGEKPVELPQRLARGGLPQRAADTFGPVGVEFGIGRREHAAQK